MTQVTLGRLSAVNHPVTWGQLSEVNHSIIWGEFCSERNTPFNDMTHTRPMSHGVTSVVKQTIQSHDSCHMGSPVS